MPLSLPDEGPDVWLMSSLVASEGGAASERLATVGMLTHIGSLSSVSSSVASQRRRLFKENVCF